MASQTSGAPRLDVGAALREGWAAFGRAPWILSGFLLLVIALNLVIDVLETSLSKSVADLPPVFQLAPLLCVLASWALNLWTVVGLVRGAWITLEGRRPTFLELVRWDGPAIGRVLLASLLLGLILTLIALPLLWLMVAALDQLIDLNFTMGGPLFRTVSPTPGVVLQLILSTLALIGVITYAQVNQHFLVQLASLRGTGAWRTLREGRAVVDRQWWPTLGLVALESLLLLAGVLALLLGLFVAVPVVFCVSTAAYRQLFEAEQPALPG
jgi:hypothetical protein